MHNNADSLSFRCVQDANAIRRRNWEKVLHEETASAFVHVFVEFLRRNPEFEIAKVTVEMNW